MKTEYVGFLFTHPVMHTMVTGSITDITGQGMDFELFRPELAEGLEVGMLLPRCSLRLGEDIVRVGCRIIAVGPPMSLSYYDLEGEDRGLLLSYLVSHNG
ncbi:MAG: hypothetical protein ACOCZ9_00870 [Spirochaetota bacterium]